MWSNLKTQQLLLLRIVGIFFCIGIGFYLYEHQLFYTAFFLLAMVFFLILELFSYQRNAFQFYDKTINAILQNDFSADFSKHKSYKNYKSLFRLYEDLKEKQNEKTSQDIIYQSILNNIETGILILQKSGNEWDIFLMNDYFSKHFAVPKVSKWHYLKSQLPSLCGIIEDQNFQESKTSLEICVNKQELQTFVMQSSRSITFNKEYYVVLLDSIQKVVEKKEKEAWINLMKVISHELLNSLTPIRSLSQNLHEIVQQETLSTDDFEDMKQSVATMLNRSNHLQQFVESYRTLAMLPSPKKEKISLQELVENSLQIMSPIFKINNIQTRNTISFNRWIMADKLQMEQVFINLLTNSLHAVKDKADKKITIAAEMKQNRIFITIFDTGNGIDVAIQDKIFLPFFTTRVEGAGIGLTLSKNIVEAHGGYLNFQNLENGSSFTICLME